MKLMFLYFGLVDSLFEKAYPQPMFISLQKAAKRCGRRLHFVIAGWFPGGEADHIRYQEAARICANVSIHFLDGKIPMLFVVVGLLLTYFIPC